MKKEITTKDNLNNKYLQREKFIEEHAQIFEALLSGMPSKQDYEQVRDHLDFLLSSQVEQQRKKIVKTIKGMGKLTAVGFWRSQFTTGNEVSAYNQALQDVITRLFSKE